MSVRFTIHALPNAREFCIKPLLDGDYKVSIPEPAEKNRANLALVKYMRQILGCNVRLVSGASGRRKVLEADIDEVAFAQRIAAASGPKKAGKRA
jgi:uncharacterized protein YggU (UPF0235/DUF167 family)